MQHGPDWNIRTEGTLVGRSLRWALDRSRIKRWKRQTTANGRRSCPWGTIPAKSVWGTFVGSMMANLGFTKGEWILPKND